MLGGQAQLWLPLTDWVTLGKALPSVCQLREAPYAAGV